MRLRNLLEAANKAEDEAGQNDPHYQVEKTVPAVAGHGRGSSSLFACLIILGRRHRLMAFVSTVVRSNTMILWSASRVPLHSLKKAIAEL